MSASQESIEAFQEPTSSGTPEIPLWAVALLLEVLTEIYDLNALHSRITRDPNQILAAIRTRLLAMHAGS